MSKKRFSSIFRWRVLNFRPQWSSTGLVPSIPSPKDRCKIVFTQIWAILGKRKFSGWKIEIFFGPLCKKIFFCVPKINFSQKLFKIVEKWFFRKFQGPRVKFLTHWLKTWHPTPSERWKIIFFRDFKQLPTFFYLWSPLVFSCFLLCKILPPKAAWKFKNIILSRINKKKLFKNFLTGPSLASLFDFQLKKQKSRSEKRLRSIFPTE